MTAWTGRQWTLRGTCGSWQGQDVPVAARLGAPGLSVGPSVPHGMVPPILCPQNAAQHVPVVTEPCGCPDRTGHAPPTFDLDLGLFHGERNPDVDEAPWTVPGTWDAYCLCGHPNYLTCEQAGQLWDMTIHPSTP